MPEYDDPELQAAAEAAARSRRADKRWKLLLAIVSILLGAVTALAVWLAVSNAQLATENASFGAQQQDEKKEIAKEASQALCGQGDRQIYDKDLCEKWAEAAQEPNVDPEVPTVISGPSQAELVAAFRTYCADGNCKGQDGQPPTPDDIAAAFARFCSDGRCTGPAGKDAQDGVDGVDGEDGVSLPPSPEMVLAAVQQVCANEACRGPAGADGAPASYEAIAAAVQQFCANEACRGPAGETGAPGAEGQAGPPPSSFTFTDQTGAQHTCVPDPPGSSTFTCTSTAPAVLPKP